MFLNSINKLVFVMETPCCCCCCFCAEGTEASGILLLTSRFSASYHSKSDAGFCPRNKVSLLSARSNRISKNTHANEHCSGPGTHPSTMETCQVIGLLPPPPPSISSYLTLFKTKQTPWSLVRERTIPTDRPPLVDEI
jgi:hypothetical protein